MAFSRVTLRKDRPIFISCATEDIEIARALKSAIQQLPRFRGYIARDEPRTFEYPSEKIAGILEVCPAFAILYTPAAIRAPMVNQELGFFYHRWRRERDLHILLIKSTEITGEIDGFAYGREPIWFDPANPKVMISNVLWELKEVFSIDKFEIECGDHVIPVDWPQLGACVKALKSGVLLEFICPLCGASVGIDPLTLMPIGPQK